MTENSPTTHEHHFQVKTRHGTRRFHINIPFMLPILGIVVFQLGNERKRLEQVTKRAGFQLDLEQSIDLIK